MRIAGAYFLTLALRPQPTEKGIEIANTSH
jgi:hypothetical protein